MNFFQTVFHFTKLCQVTCTLPLLGHIGSLHRPGQVRSGACSQLLCSSLYYFGEYHSRLGLEKEIWVSKKILKWVGLDFVSDSEQNLTQSHFKIFFETQISFSSSTGPKVKLATTLQNISHQKFEVSFLEQKSGNFLR